MSEEIRERLVDAARTELGTKFKHQGRVPGKGVDCSGLCVVTAQKVGWDLSAVDRTDYARVPNQESFVESLRVALDEIPVESAIVGDWLVFWLSRRATGTYQWPQHMAMITGLDPTRIIHAVAERRKVVEHELRAVAFGSLRWEQLVKHAFRYRQLRSVE